MNPFLSSQTQNRNQNSENWSDRNRKSKRREKNRNPESEILFQLGSKSWIAKKLGIRNRNPFSGKLPYLEKPKINLTNRTHWANSSERVRLLLGLLTEWWTTGKWVTEHCIVTLFHHCSIFFGFHRYCPLQPQITSLKPTWVLFTFNFCDCSEASLHLDANLKTSCFENQFPFEVIGNAL